MSKGVSLAILSVLAILFLSWVPSASSAFDAETRVAAFDFADGAHVRHGRSLTLELRRGYAPTYDEIASGSLLAAKGGKGLGSNPFKGKSPAQIDKMLRDKGYIPKGPDPLNGKGTYLNPKTGRSVHIDANHPPPKPPHVSVQRPRGSRNLPPREYPIK